MSNQALQPSDTRLALAQGVYERLRLGLDNPEQGLCKRTNDGLQVVQFLTAVISDRYIALPVDVRRLPVQIRTINAGMHDLAIVVGHDTYTVTGFEVAGHRFGYSIVIDLAAGPGGGPRPTTNAGAGLPRQVAFDRAHQPGGAYPLPIGVLIPFGQPKRPDQIKHHWLTLPEAGHIVIAAMTGAGKTGIMRGILCALQLTETPATLQLALVDPKQVEFAAFRDSPFLAWPVAYSLGRAIQLTDDLGAEVNRRLEIFAANAVYSLEDFNAKFPTRAMPRIVLAIDEMKDLMTRGGRRSPFYNNLIAGASLWRAAGVNVIMATTDPRADTIDPSLMTNCGVKIVGKLSRSVSTAILGNTAADGLPTATERPGLFLARLPGQRGLVEFQAYYVSNDQYNAMAGAICKRAQVAGYVEPEPPPPAKLAPPSADDQAPDHLSEIDRLVYELINLPVEQGGLGGLFSVRSCFEAAKAANLPIRKGDLDGRDGVSARWGRWGWLESNQAGRDKRRITAKMLEDLGLTLTTSVTAE